jgi:hypothetical protein
MENDISPPHKEAIWSGFEDDPPELAPIIATEKLEDGWRGLTEDGEVYAVRGGKIPESLMVARAGRVIGQRKIVAVNGVDIGGYLENFKRAVELHKSDRNLEALFAIEAAIAAANTLRARFNRGMILLALGRWPEGFADFELCEREPPFQRPASQTALTAGVRPWQGEPLTGKRLLLVHDHGLGDTVMMLRYVPVLATMGADVVMFVPPELTRIAAQFGIVTANSLKIAAQACDYFCSFLHLLRWLAATPSSVPARTFVAVEPSCVARWQSVLPETSRRRVGLAWSVGVEQHDDFPRSLPVAEMVARFGGDAEYHSLQIQDRAAAGEAGVVCHDFADLAECAALMSLMDEVISVDTLAIHLAGAIGHPNATLLLSRWHSWRWHNNPFYPGIRILESGR